MSIDPRVIAKLRKLHAMMGSPIEAEAKSARDKIHKILLGNNMTWNDFTELMFSSKDDKNTTPKNNSSSVTSPFTPDFTPLDLVSFYLRQYLSMQEHEYIAVAGWIVHTHIFDRFMVTPRLILTSPVRGCGKTTLLDLCEALVSRPAKEDGISAASIYHMITAGRPTFLLDEGDNLGLVADATLRAVLNSGHRKGGKFTRLANGRPRTYNTFAPLALASIGALPLPLMHRSLVIRMERHDGGKELHRLDTADAAAMSELRIAGEQIALWARDVSLGRDPALPSNLRNRPADNWRPLVAVADACGEAWGRCMREAAVTFAAGQHEEDVAVILLRDIRNSFDARGVDRLPSIVIIGDLTGLDDGIWGEWRGIRGDQPPRKLTPPAMAAMLREFGIRPRSVWPPRREAASRSSKGYYRHQFEAAWRAYCPDDGTAAQPRDPRRLRLV